MTIQRHIAEFRTVTEERVVGAIQVVDCKYAATGYAGIVRTAHQVVAIGIYHTLIADVGDLIAERPSRTRIAG